jgi:hypothetical protein
MIKKVGNSYALYSRTGKVLFRSKSRSSVVHREKQIVYFKNDKQYLKDHGRHIPITKKKGKK